MDASSSPVGVRNPRYSLEWCVSTGKTKRSRLQLGTNCNMPEERALAWESTPVEIWHAIIYWALYDPSAFDIYDPRHVFLDSVTSASRREVAIERVERQRLNLCLVCKGWKVYAENNLRIRAKWEENCYRPLAGNQSTLLCVELADIMDCDDPRSFISDSLLSLKIEYSGNPSDPPYPLHQPFANELLPSLSSICTSLRSLSICLYGEQCPKLDFIRICAYFPRLVALGLLGNLVSSHHIKPVSMQYLECLELQRIDIFIDCLPSWQLPRLRHCSINHEFGDFQTAIQIFLPRFGLQLSTFSINRNSWSPNRIDLEEAMWTYMSNVETLGLPCSGELLPPPQNIHSLPKLRYILVDKRILPRSEFLAWVFQNRNNITIETTAEQGGWQWREWCDLAREFRVCVVARHGEVYNGNNSQRRMYMNA